MAVAPIPPEAAAPQRSGWLETAVGAVLVTAILYVGRDVFVPLAVAILLTFVLAPLVIRLVRLRVPRMLSVLLVTLLAFALLGAFAVVVGSQLTGLLQELPAYQANIEAKLVGAREATPGGSALDRTWTMLQELRAELEPVPAAEASDVPLVQLRPAPSSALDVLAEIATPLLGPIGKAGIVIVLVFFFLLEREDLRNRLIRLLGSNLHLTTEMLDEAGRRVSRYLLMQLVVNVTYGVPLGVGLYAIGIPNAALWAALAVILRFIPYVGPVFSAVFPLLLAIAVDPGWTTFVLTAALILGLELVSNNFVEPRLYGASTSVSTVAIILAAIFWTTLWGPIGLLVATPLTVCLAVLGRYFPDLRFLDVLLGSAPALSLPERFYQRLLAGDVDENVRIARARLEHCTLTEFYDDVALPALALAAEANLNRAFSSDTRFRVTRSVLRVVAELADHDEREQDVPSVGSARQPTRLLAHRSVLCAAGRSGLDHAVVAMLAQLLERNGLAARPVPAEALTRNGLSGADLGSFDAVCVSYLEAPSPVVARQTRQRIGRLAQDKPVVVGHWRRPANAAAQPAADDTRIVTSLAAAVDEVLRATAVPDRPFSCAPIPDDERERLSDLDELGLLAVSSETLDRYTRRLAEAFRVPVALITLVDEGYQHWKGQTGLPEDLALARRAPRDTSICGHVVAANQVMVIEDALKDQRFATNPFLLEHGIRFYAGAPLRSRGGHAIGSVCVIDAVPRAVTPSETALLQMIAEEVMKELEAAAGRPRLATAGAA